METKTDIEILRYIYPWNVQTYDFTFCSIMIMRVFPLRLHNFCVCSFFFIIKTNQYTFYINFIQLFNISFSPYPLGTMHAQSMQLSYLHSIIQDCLINWFWEDIIAQPGAFLSWLGGVGCSADICPDNSVNSLLSDMLHMSAYMDF